MVNFEEFKNVLKQNNFSVNLKSITANQFDDFGDIKRLEFDNIKNLQGGIDDYKNGYTHFAVVNIQNGDSLLNKTVISFSDYEKKMYFIKMLDIIGIQKLSNYTELWKDE